MAFGNNRYTQLTKFSIASEWAGFTGELGFVTELLIYYNELLGSILCDSYIRNAKPIIGSYAIQYIVDSHC